MCTRMRSRRRRRSWGWGAVICECGWKGVVVDPLAFLARQSHAPRSECSLCPFHYFVRYYLPLFFFDVFVSIYDQSDTIS